MTKSEQPDTNDQLHAVLGEWTVEAKLTPQFKARVWSEISRVEAERSPVVWRALLDWLTTGLVRPSWAASYLMVLLVAGLLVGYWQATTKIERESDRMRERYVQAVNPYHAPRLAP